MAKIVSFINYKGGVGKTTIAVETAVTLAKQYGFKVLVIDLDPQTNATFYLASEQEWDDWTANHGSLKDVLEAAVANQHINVDEMIMEGRYGLVDLLPSHLDLLPMDMKLAGRFGAESSGSKTIIKGVLAPVIEDKGYDFVVVDCPPNLNLVTQNGLMLSDSYVVVCLPEYLSVRGIGLIETHVGEMMNHINNDLGRLGAPAISGPKMRGIIFNRVKYVTGGTIDQQNWMTDVRRDYPHLTFDGYVSESVKVAEASYRSPISLSGKSIDRAYVEQLSVVAEEFFNKVVSD